MHSFCSLRGSPAEEELRPVSAKLRDWRREELSKIMFPGDLDPGTDGSNCSVAVIPLGLASCGAGFEVLIDFGGNTRHKTSTAHDQAAAAAT